MIYIKVIDNNVMAFGFEVEDAVLIVSENEWVKAGNDAHIDENGHVILGVKVKNEQSIEESNQNNVDSGV